MENVADLNQMDKMLSNWFHDFSLFVNVATVTCIIIIMCVQHRNKSKERCNGAEKGAFVAFQSKACLGSQNHMTV